MLVGTVAAVFSAALAAAAWVAPAHAGPAAETGLRFTSSGYDGAGFVNVLAVSPYADRTGSVPLVAGGDVAGPLTSGNGGEDWQVADRGLTSDQDSHVAALAFVPGSAGIVYAATGDNVTSGSLFVSRNFGASWQRQSSTLWFNGGNDDLMNYTGAALEHPRSTGRLIVADGAGRVWAATYHDGVRRSADSGASWPASALTTAPPLDLGNGVNLGTRHYLRGLAQDPTRPDTLYAASFGRGVFASTDATRDMTFRPLTGGPLFPEEMVVVGGKLYVAAQRDGVWRYDPSTSRWTSLNAGTLATGAGGSYWESVAGYRDRASGRTVLYVGCARPVGGNSVYKSTDGGAHWTSVTTAASVHDTYLGSSTVWWQLAANPSARMDGGSFVAAQLVVDPVDPAVVYVAGRAGVWKTTDSGGNWYPATRGMGLTVSDAVTADPSAPSDLYVATTDWVFITSPDHLATVAQNRPASSAADRSGSSAKDVAVRSGTSTVYVGAGARDTNESGEVWSNPDPLHSRTWTDEGLSDATGGNRVQCVTTRTGDVVIAGVEEGSSTFGGVAGGGGIWRESAGVWTKTSPPGLLGAGLGQRCIFASAPGSPVLYVYDRGSGIWRSSDSGKPGTWTLIYARRSTVGNHAGYLATDPTTPGRLYASVDDGTVAGVLRFDNADTSTAATTVLGSFAHPGALAVGPRGALYVHVPPTSAAPATLYRSTDGGATFSVVSDAHYQQAAARVNAMSVGADGYVYVVTQGTGVLVGVPTPLG